jgi:hypothetical protein
MKESGELSGSLPGCSVYPANKSWGKPQIRQSFCSNAMTDCIIEIQRLKFDPAHTAHMREMALDTHEHLRLKIDQQQRRIVG